MMRRNDMMRGSTGGVIVGVIYGLVLLFVSPAWADRPPEGLPDSPEIPDLYDPVIVDTYTIVAKRPYQVNGRELAPWLIATVLTPKAAHVGPPLVSATPDATGGTPEGCDPGDRLRDRYARWANHRVVRNLRAPTRCQQKHQGVG